MKVLEAHVPEVIGNCPNCNSKLQIEKGDVHWYKDISGVSSPYVTCPICRKSIDVEGWKNIRKIL